MQNNLIEKLFVSCFNRSRMKKKLSMPMFCAFLVLGMMWTVSVFGRPSRYYVELQYFDLDRAGLVRVMSGYGTDDDSIVIDQAPGISFKFHVKQSNHQIILHTILNSKKTRKIIKERVDKTALDVFVEMNPITVEGHRIRANFAVRRSPLYEADQNH